MQRKDQKKQPRKHLLTRDRGRSDVPNSPLHGQLLKLILRNNVEHLQGPEEIAYEKDELVVLCLLYNGRHYLRSFIEHYFSLGAKHIVFLDNGSTDGTVEALRDYENVTVLRSTLHFKKYQLLLRQYLVERFGRQRWTLLVDQDELFDYPYSDVVDIGTLLRYLNEHSYTAVAAYMLDMFPEDPISIGVTAAEDESLKKIHRFYDISNVRVQDYRLADDTGNVRANEDVEVLRDGIRHTLFGNLSMLMKHPLVFLDDRLKPMDLSDHWVGNARIADFTGVLLHYKFLNRLYEDIRRLVEERNRSDVGLNTYSRYLKVLEQSPSLQIKQETAKELESVNDLLGTRFAVVSREYLRLALEEGLKKGGESFLQGYAERITEAFFEARAQERAQRRRAEDLERQLSGIYRHTAGKKPEKI